jgi:hypothetical protein
MVLHGKLCGRVGRRRFLLYGPGLEIFPGRFFFCTPLPLSPRFSEIFLSDVPLPVLAKNKQGKNSPSFATGRSFVIALTVRHFLSSTVNLK